MTAKMTRRTRLTWPEWSAVVRGIPRPQGSKRAMVNPKTGRAMVLEQNSGTHRRWRDTLTAVAQETAPASPLQGPVLLQVTCTFPRPLSHYHMRKSGPVLRMDAPSYCTGRGHGDLSKLVRAIEDSLADAGVISDDTQIAVLNASKHWCCRFQDVSGAAITVRGLSPEAVEA